MPVFRAMPFGKRRALITSLWLAATPVMADEAPQSQCQLQVSEVADSQDNHSLDDAQQLSGYLYSLAHSDDIGDTDSNTSTTIPHTTVKVTGDVAYEYFAIEVLEAPAKLIIDVDNSVNEHFDSVMVLLDPQGKRLAGSNESPADYGQGGSQVYPHNFNGNSIDAYIETTIEVPGNYRLVIYDWGLEEPVYIGTRESFDLQVSLEVTDADGDGLGDAWETKYGLDPGKACDWTLDDDGDGLDGLTEARLGTSDENTDSDADGLGDWQEVNEYGTSPVVADSDGDGLTDGQEVQRFKTDPLNADSDGDLASDGDEVNQLDTEPLDPDTDGDSMPDGLEANAGLDPKVMDDLVDSDGDGLNNVDELLTHNSKPLVADTDGDGLLDGQEVLATLTSPILLDSDGDLLPDGWEVAHLFDLNADEMAADSDGDGWSNFEEYTWGSFPKDSTSVPSRGEKIYVLGEDKTLHVVDTLQRTKTIVGVVDLPVQYAPSDMAFGPDGQLYMVAGKRTALSLYRVNPTNAESTEIGPLALDRWVTALAFDGQGQLLLSSRDEIYRADVYSGELSLITTVAAQGDYTIIGGMGFNGKTLMVLMDGSGAYVGPQYKLFELADIENGLLESGRVLDAEKASNYGFLQSMAYDQSGHWWSVIESELIVMVDNKPGPTMDTQLELEAIAIDHQLWDSDSDGMLDRFETEHGLDKSDPADAAKDLDGDGLTNLQEQAKGSLPNKKDSDGDGVDDADDAFPLDANYQKDFDKDGIADKVDLDLDNDLRLNENDLFPLDSLNWADQDGDGLGDNIDSDRDNDGYPNDSDAFPTDPNEWLDTDHDGVGNNTDTDDDGDNLPDSYETEFGLDPLNADDALADSDNDGFNNLEEFIRGSNPVDASSLPNIGLGWLPLLVE